MEIAIKAEPKEIAVLVVELKEKLSSGLIYDLTLEDVKKLTDELNKD